jgi:hypothetical protein
MEAMADSSFGEHLLKQMLADDAVSSQMTQAEAILRVNCYTWVTSQGHLQTLPFV